VNVLNLASTRAHCTEPASSCSAGSQKRRYFVERRVQEGEEGPGYIPVRDVPGGEGEIDTRISIEFRATR